ncbi:hypothetical protein LMG29542_07492 [Paraburkholderia humisilvae]|uniref:IstB-like ATP-binding domain-containing protein n=1 Tax=Paraburkholderia humisilvae TaxID=627669 RepID=A0A6J5F516_9BURK|nr:hypothetical protein LMG29542_07492 [Paraburkholderia humisilvae]
MSGPASTLERIRRYLVGLRMPRALEALDATLNRFEQGDSSMLEVLETLLGEEFTTRETRRIRMALQTARLGTIKTLAGYDFSFQPSLERDRIMTLAQLEFIERRQTVHFLGPPGTGKSHLSIEGAAKILDWFMPHPQVGSIYPTLTPTTVGSICALLVGTMTHQLCDEEASIPFFPSRRCNSFICLSASPSSNAGTTSSPALTADRLPS